MRKSAKEQKNRSKRTSKKNRYFRHVYQLFIIDIPVLISKKTA